MTLQAVAGPSVGGVGWRWLEHGYRQDGMSRRGGVNTWAGEAARRAGRRGGRWLRVRVAAGPGWAEDLMELAHEARVAAQKVIDVCRAEVAR